MAFFDDTPPADPIKSAQRLSAPIRQKRFYTRAEAAAENGLFVLRLDGMRALTPGRKPLATPDSRLAEAIVREWTAQGETIDPASMPVTRLANSAIDGVADRIAEVRDSVLAYAGTDLLFYRAGEPDRLVQRQREHWDPILAWAERRFGVRFILAEGVVHVAQPERTLKTIRAALAQEGNVFRLAGLNLATTLSGSALIALALAENAIGVEEAWTAGHVDEDWNISQWGADEEAMQRRARRFDDFRAAALALGNPT
jgi:chaperone required for assembly of F1-ATPase